MKRGTYRGMDDRNEKGANGGWVGYVNLMVGRTQEMKMASGTQEKASIHSRGPRCWGASISTQEGTSRLLWEASSSQKAGKGSRKGRGRGSVGWGPWIQGSRWGGRS